MKTTNKLISIVLTVAMLVSLMPSAVFADDGQAVARIGDAAYETLDDALNDAVDDGTEIELLQDAEISDGYTYAALTVNMKGHTIIADTLTCIMGGITEFNGGTIKGELCIQADDAQVSISAPSDSECALDGGAVIDAGALSISGAKVGLRGTLTAETETEFDISGTEKAVELSAEPSIGENYKVIGSADGGDTMNDVVYEDGTYKADGQTAKRIKLVKKPSEPVSKPTLSPREKFVCPGRSTAFAVDYSGALPLVANVQKNAQDSTISAAVSADGKSIIVTATKDATPGKTYPLHVYPQNKGTLSDTVTVTICDHKNGDSSAIDSTYKCEKCGAMMTACVIKSGNTDYYSDLQAAADSIPADATASDCALMLLSDTELDDYLKINGKSFTYKVLNDAKISFSKSGCDTIINDDTNGNPSNVETDGDIILGKIRLGGNSSLKISEGTTINSLSLMNNTVKIDINGKVEKLSANSGIKLADFLDEDTDFYNYQTDMWFGSEETSGDALEYVTMKKKPFKNFLAYPYSKTLVCLGSNIIYCQCTAVNVSSFNPAKAQITAELPNGISLVQNRMPYISGNVYHKEWRIDNLPAGEYTIPFTLNYDGYTETQTVTFSVSPISVENNSDITVKINDKTDDFAFDYARGEQTLAVKVFDKDADITDSFDISGNTVDKAGTYSVTITAKDGSNYSGTVSKSVMINKIVPEIGKDFSVDIPYEPPYDGLAKEVTITPLNNSGIGSDTVTVEYYKYGSSEKLSSAPSDAGKYEIKLNIPETENYLSWNGKLSKTLYIAKAITEFEADDFTFVYGDEIKLEGKLKKAGETAKAPSGIMDWRADDKPGMSVVGQEELDENGGFEITIDNEYGDNTGRYYYDAGKYEIKLTYSGDDNYRYALAATRYFTVNPFLLSLKVSGKEHRYAPNTERGVTLSPEGSDKVSADDLTVKYYLVDENSGKLASANPVDKAISAGRYLYVVSFADAAKGKNYYFGGNNFEVSDTAVPNISDYANIGFMDIKAASEVSQKPISFARGIVTVKSGEQYTNVLRNENNSAITYESSDTDIAEVAPDGTVTAKSSGTATITATSVMEGATPVYASYTVNVKKELDKDSFVITAASKVYDGSADAEVTAVLSDKADENDVVTVSMNASFDSADAGDRTVSYEITGIFGRDADKYILTDDADKLKGTVDGAIAKAPVSVICAAVTTRTFDGSAQTADISAMANGKAFDKSGYTVKYGGKTEVKDVGDYKITIELNEETAKNYFVSDIDAVLKIVSAAQDVFAIENIPENVYYGDKFKPEATGAAGNVKYEITNGRDIASIDAATNEITVSGTGTVTVTATSTKEGYSDKTAVRTFAAKPRILTPSAKTVYQNNTRVYDGTNAVEVEIALDNVVGGDSVTASAVGTMINSDVGDGKIVYVSGINLSDTERYTLSTGSLQTTVDIDPIVITDIEISAADKKYDGTANAQVNIDKIHGVLGADKGLVSVVGSAEFADKNADKDEKTVTFTPSALVGTRAANYVLGAVSATAKARINPLDVSFAVGQTSFVYDGTDKELTVSATDENGRIFNDFRIDYSETPNKAGSYTAKIVLNDSVNYTADTDDIIITVLPAAQNQLVITGVPGTVEYGDTFTLEAFGGADDGTVTWQVTSGSATISQNGEVVITGIGKTEICAVKTSGNYKDTSAKAVFSAMPKSITFEMGNLEQTYGNVSAVTVTRSGDKVGKDEYEITYDGNASLPQNAGKYKVNVVSANPNYKGCATENLVINKASANGEIKIDDVFTYGETVAATAEKIPDGATVKITYAGTGIYIPQETAPKNAGSYTAIATISGENYETLVLTKNFKIKKAPLAVKADDKTRAYGESNPVFTLKYDGFINGDTKDVLLYEPTATVAANASSAVGEYDITVSGGYAENYEFVYDNTGKLKITGASGARLDITNLPGTVYVNDTFMLGSFYGNTKINAAWSSSNSEIAEVDSNGNVAAKKAGTVAITATADDNYGNASATVEFTVKQASINLVPTDLVKTYNGKRQDISFEAVSGFTPIISGENKNIDVKYTLTTDPTVTEPIKAGTYVVAYILSDAGYSGGGTTTMYINKANVEIKPKDITKEYGEKPKFGFVSECDFVSETELDDIAKNAIFTSDGAAETAAVKDGGYDITAVLGKAEDDNIRYNIAGGGKLTVTKAPLAIKVKDITKEYGAENPALELEYVGFKNGETETVLGGEARLAYEDDINDATPVGMYTGKTTVDGLTADNYDITYAKGNVTVTKIGVTAAAGTARESYITVVFDKALHGLAADSFAVKDGENVVAVTSVTESNDGRTYSLNGTFAVGTAYEVTISLANTQLDATYEIKSGNPLTIIPTRSGSSGGGGGGGSSSYTVRFETNGGSKISSQSAAKNGTVKRPADPTKDGYTFGGWFADNELKSAYDFDSKVTKSITLYAAWTKIETEPEPDPTDKPIAGSDPFGDVGKDDWYYDDIVNAVNKGLFNGTGDRTFAPNESITRAMFVTVLYRIEGEPAVDGNTSFADIAADNYYANAVVWAAQNGIVKGFSETEFAPNDNIAREQMAAMMFRYAKFKGYDVSQGGMQIREFEDFESISAYAAEPMTWAVNSGLIKGKTETTINPHDNATRAETAAILNRFLTANN